MHMGWVDGSKGRWLGRGERGRIGDGLGEWDGGKVGRMDMGAGKYISQLREHFRVYKDLILEVPRSKDWSPDCSLSSRGEGT